MIVKTHSTNDNRLILTICDEDLIGKKYEDGEKQLDLTSDFYQGEKMQEEAVISLIKKAYMVNAVGKKSVRCCIKVGVVDKKSVGKINEIPYVYMVRF